MLFRSPGSAGWALGDAIGGVLIYHPYERASEKLRDSMLWTPSLSSAFGEMLPAAGFQDSCLTIFVQDFYCWPVIFSSPYHADLGGLHAGDLVGNVCLSGSGEQQLIVFTSVQGQVEIGILGDGNRRGIDCCGDTAFPANVSEVDGETIAEVD